MTKSNIIRSPLFYTGDKYKIMGEIKRYFPQKINKFIEPFVGGGSVFLNVEAECFLLNDIDKNIMTLHEFISSFENVEILENELFGIIKKYNLSCSYIGNTVPMELRKQFVKTYFAKYNKDAFLQMKKDFNLAKEKSPYILYLLLIYGFNRMLRFNSKGCYNVPVGNVDYNQNVHEALENYITLTNKKNIAWFNEDYNSFLSKIKFFKNDFVYLDPPYLIGASEYNKLWNQKDDDNLLLLLDELNYKKIKFAFSNIINYKGKENAKLLEWAKNYHVHSLKNNYINYHDNSIKGFKEVLITNYEK